MSFRKSPPTNHDLQRRGEASSPRTMEAIISQWISGKTKPESSNEETMNMIQLLNQNFKKKKEIWEYHAENHWRLGPLETGLFTTYGSNYVHWGSRPWIPGWKWCTPPPWIVTMCHGLNPVPGYVSRLSPKHGRCQVAQSGKAETSDRMRHTPGT